MQQGATGYGHAFIWITFHFLFFAQLDFTALYSFPHQSQTGNWFKDGILERYIEQYLAKLVFQNNVMGSSHPSESVWDFEGLKALSAPAELLRKELQMIDPTSLPTSHPCFPSLSIPSPS